MGLGVNNEMFLQVQVVTKYVTYRGVPPDVLDFVEERLVWLISEADNAEMRGLLRTVLHDYQKGLIAVAFKAGKPVTLRTSNIAQ
jgi:hypothetical protein